MRPSYAQRAKWYSEHRAQHAQRVRYARCGACAPHCQGGGSYTLYAYIPYTQEGSGAVRRRSLSSPVSTRSPELSGSFPSDRFPRAARLPQKISPRRRASILERGHSNEGCCAPEPCFRIRVR
jgi:hypothetical protein